MDIEPHHIYFNDGVNMYSVPFYMIEGLDVYINRRIKQGSFLHAVLCNDLIEAVRCADEKNMANLPAYANFLYNYAPRECYGSREKVEKWLSGGHT